MITCQGYCGGSFRLEDLRAVGKFGEMFCEECYGLLLRQQYGGDLL